MSGCQSSTAYPRVDTPQVADIGIHETDSRKRQFESRILPDKAETQSRRVNSGKNMDQALVRFKVDHDKSTELVKTVSTQ